MASVAPTVTDIDDCSTYVPKDPADVVHIGVLSIGRHLYKTPYKFEGFTTFISYGSYNEDKAGNVAFV